MWECVYMQVDFIELWIFMTLFACLFVYQFYFLYYKYAAALSLIRRTRKCQSCKFVVNLSTISVNAIL